MKKYFLKPFTLKLTALFALLLAIIIIHSCKKDNKSTQLTDPAVAQAKVWYENTYPMKSSTNGKLTTQSTGNQDLSQWIKPDWQRCSKYKKLGKDVIEMPIDPSSKFGSLAHIGGEVTNRAYSRSYFLLLNYGKSYTAYIMMVLADSDYVKNDTSKISRNTYLKNDADFSGKVIYLTPKGEYLGGNAYRNGQLVIPVSATRQTGNQKVQSTGSSILKPENMVQQCTDWYLDYYVDGAFWFSQYIGRTCANVDISDGGSGGGGGGGSGTTPPPACAPAAPPVQNSIDGSHLTVNFIPPPDPCTPPIVVTQDITDNLKDPCLKTVLGNLKNNNLNGKIADIINDVFGSSDKVNITFNQKNDPTDTIPARTVGSGPSGNGTFNAAITLNLSRVGEGSQEFKAIIMVHEVLHAYMDYNTAYKSQLQQHQQMAQKYVNDIKAFVQGLYPTLSDPDAYAMILNGMGDVYNNNQTAYNAVLHSFNTSQANYEFQRSGLSGTPCSSN